MRRIAAVAFAFMAMTAVLNASPSSAWHSTNDVSIDYRTAASSVVVAVELRNRHHNSIRAKYSIWLEGSDSPTTGVSTWIPSEDSRVVEGSIATSRGVERVDVHIIEEAR